jgi:tetrahydromethanopterin S-methyltransferase subunit G
MIWVDDKTGAVNMDQEEYDGITKKIKELEQRVIELEKYNG